MVVGEFSYSCTSGSHVNSTCLLDSIDHLGNPFLFLNSLDSYFMSSFVESIETRIFKSPTEFSQFIEQTAITERMRCSDVLIDYSDYLGVEFTDIAKMVSESLKMKLRIEMQEAGMLPKSTAAPLDGCL